jgi:cytochrome c oxidase assembly factor CtaG
MCLFGIVMIESAIAGNEGLAGYPQRRRFLWLEGLVMVIIMAATISPVGIYCQIHLCVCLCSPFCYLRLW